MGGTSRRCLFFNAKRTVEEAVSLPRAGFSVVTERI